MKQMVPYMIVALCCSMVDSGVVQNIHQPFLLQYEANIDAVILSQENVKGKIEFALIPVTATSLKGNFMELKLESLVYDIGSQPNLIVFPRELLSSRSYWQLTDTGVVSRTYSSASDQEQVALIKQYLASALSGHLQIKGQGDDHGLYIEEEDHTGLSMHDYRYFVDKESNSRRVKRSKQGNHGFPFVNNKTYHLDEDGVITHAEGYEFMQFPSNFNIDISNVESDEHYNTFNSSVRDLQIESRITVKLITKRNATKVETINEASLASLKNATLQIKPEEDAHLGEDLQTAQRIVLDALKCTSKYDASIYPREYTKCLSKPREILPRLSSAHLLQLAKKHLQERCDTNFLPCWSYDARRTMLALIGNVGTPAAQKALVQYGLHSIDDEEKQKALFHLAIGKHVTKEAVDAVSLICFGEDVMDYGNIGFDDMQKKSCLALGGMLKSYKHNHEEHAKFLLQQLHSWIDTDNHLEDDYFDDKERSGQNHEESYNRSTYIFKKVGLIHMLGNAGHESSKRRIMSYAVPNKAHGDLRFAAMAAMRHYDCQETATTLLNASLHDGSEAIRRIALKHYKNHPRAYTFTAADEDLLISKNRSLKESLLQGSKEVKCSLVDELTRETGIIFSDIHWEKDLGIKFIGANFGFKMINKVSVITSPASLKFAINIDNGAWFKAHIKFLMFNHDFDLLDVGICYVKEVRMYSGNTMVNYNLEKMMNNIAEFDAKQQQIVNPIVQSVNDLYFILDNWEYSDGVLDLHLPFERDNSGIIDRTRLNHMHRLSNDIVYFLQANELNSQQSVLDRCLSIISTDELQPDYGKTAKRTKDCLAKHMLVKTEKARGMLANFENLLSSMRMLREGHSDIRAHINGLRNEIPQLSDPVLKKHLSALYLRSNALVSDSFTATNQFLAEVMDETVMTLQFIVMSIDEASRAIGDVLPLLDLSPNAAFSDIDRAIERLKAAVGAFSQVRAKITESSISLKGKLASWTSDYSETISIMQDIRRVQSILETIEQTDTCKTTNMRECLYQNSRKSSMDPLIKLLWKLHSSLFDLNHLADDYLFNLKTVDECMQKSFHDLEALLMRAEASKNIMHQIMGLHFHHKFPNQIRRECDTACGGCGIYPNVLNGRAGIQLITRIGKKIVSPLNGRLHLHNEPSSIIIYPTQRNLRNIEIAIANVKLDKTLDVGTQGLYVEAGTKIGVTTLSNFPKCTSRFLHVSVRRLNSTKVEFDGSVRDIEDHQSEDCEHGPTDFGMYMRPDELIAPKTPLPFFRDTCGHAVFKILDYVDNYHEIGHSDETTRFDLEVPRNSEDISNDISLKETQDITLPDELMQENINQIKIYIAQDALEYKTNIYHEAVRDKHQVTYSINEDSVRSTIIEFETKHELPSITEFFSPMAMSVDEFNELLLECELTQRSNELWVALTSLADSIKSHICNNIIHVEDIKIRLNALNNLNVELNTTKQTLRDISYHHQLSSCSQVFEAMEKSENNYCFLSQHDNCDTFECNVPIRTSTEIENIAIAVHMNPCEDNTIFFINGTRIVVDNLDVTERLLLHSFIIDSYKNVTIKLDKTKSGQVQYYNLYLVSCDTRVLLCSREQYLLKNLPFSRKKHESCRIPSLVCQDGSGERAGSSTLLDEVLRSNMGNLIYMLNSFEINSSNVLIAIEETRAAMVTQLIETQTTITSVDELTPEIPSSIKELMFTDLFGNQTYEEIPFFALRFSIPPFRFSASSYGVVETRLGVQVQALQANVMAGWEGKVYGTGIGSGELCLFIGSVGLEMEGTLLETALVPHVDFRWPQFPVTAGAHVMLTLVPLGIKMTGKIKVLFIPIPIPIFSWTADKIKGYIISKSLKIRSDSAPSFDDFVPEDRSCLMEQIPGRDPSHPAFYMEVPVHDFQSFLEIHYRLGSYTDGDDLLPWTPLNGGFSTFPLQIPGSGLPVHVTVNATNTDGNTLFLHCNLDAYDITPPSGRMQATFLYTSNPDHLSASLIVIEDSDLLPEQYVAVGVGKGVYGDQVIQWNTFDLSISAFNQDAENELSYFTPGKMGKLTSTPSKSLNILYDYLCAQECLDLGDSCVSFDYNYQSGSCDLHWTIEGMDADLTQLGSYHNFEKLGAGYSAYFSFEELNLIQAESYYINAKIKNNRGFESYLISEEIIADFTPPEPGPIGDAINDTMEHAGCSATITHAERCKNVTSLDNHRIIHDGPGAATVFNGNMPGYDQRYSMSNHYIAANWDGFHDNETGIWGYTWAVGRRPCDASVKYWDDPHSHLADSSYWTHQGLADDLLLEDGDYYVSVQALNGIIYGGALVTTVCHTTPLVIDTSPPFMHLVSDVFYDAHFDLMGVYYSASDPESGIKRTDIGLGETKHDVFVRPYSAHEPLHDGYEMISLDGVDLPIGLPVWIRIRVKNNVDLTASGHGEEPIMLDPTPPVPGSIADGNIPLVDMQYQNYTDKICVQWYDWFDPESGIDSYLWGIGSSPYADDVMKIGQRSFPHTENSACETTLNLHHNSTYYNFIQASNKALDSRSTLLVSDGITLDATSPSTGYVNDGPDPVADMAFSSQAASVYASWHGFDDPESNIDNFKVKVLINDNAERVYHKNGEETTLEDHTMHFEHGDHIQIHVISENGALSTSEASSSGFKLDLTPPELAFIHDHEHGLRYQTYNDTMYSSWRFDDTESNIIEYRLKIIEHKGQSTGMIWPRGSSYFSFYPEVNETTITQYINNLTLKNGIKYSLEVTALNGASMASKQESKGVVVDTTPPAVARVYIGQYGPEETLNDNGEIIHDNHNFIPASWDGHDYESGIIKYLVAVGIYEGDDSVTRGYMDVGPADQVLIDDILLNETSISGNLYYVTVVAINGAGAPSNPCYSKPIHVYGENVAGLVYDGRSLCEDEDYTQDVMTYAVSFAGFESPACGIRSYEWALGSQPGYSDILPYTSYGLVMLNESHGRAEVHVPLQSGDVVYASVVAHTGHKCSEAMLHSSSNGMTIDSEPPEIVINELGVFGNDSSDDIQSAAVLFQQEKDYIAFSWNTSDDSSGSTNDTWMAGKLPFEDDIHEMTETNTMEIPNLAVVMTQGESVFFTVATKDMAGNARHVISPQLTIDPTPPIIQGLKCNDYLSMITMEIRCHWDQIVDYESGIHAATICLGSMQRASNFIKPQHVLLQETSWFISLNTVNVTQYLQSIQSVFVTLEVWNNAKVYASENFEIKIDSTPPDTGTLIITTPVSVSDEVNEVLCQQSLTTLRLTWYNFVDTESSIEHYEVALGSSPGNTDVFSYTNIGLNTSVLLTDINMRDNSKIFAQVRAVNNANLVSLPASSEVYISQNPDIRVIDGLSDDDINFQNSLTQLSGQIQIISSCPIAERHWKVIDILDNVIMESTLFYGDSFANDELQLLNFYTYIILVDLIDVNNRSLRAMSNGVMTALHPPTPGAVRDGPDMNEDRNYQESTTILSANWDVFGDPDDPAQEIVYYEVAIGDNPSYTSSRSNIHYYVNVGLNNTYTIYHLNLVAYDVVYYATVRATSVTGAYVESVSTGVRTGYSPGMQSADVYVTEYSSNNTFISFYWDTFISDFPISSYGYTIGSSSFKGTNQTMFCEELERDLIAWADVKSLTMIDHDMIANVNNLSLQHNTRYFVYVLAKDAAGQCITSATESFLVDLTPPLTGDIEIGNNLATVKYTLNKKFLRVSWHGFTDPESGLEEFYIQLLREPSCESASDVNHWIPLSKLIDVKYTDNHLFMDLDIKMNIPYRIRMQVKNYAHLVTESVSSAIFLDQTTPTSGTVMDGDSWFERTLYQNTTSELNAVTALSPAGQVACVSGVNLITHDNASWVAVETDILKNTQNPFKEEIHIKYLSRNIYLSSEDHVSLDFHYNISTSLLEGGFLRSTYLSLLEGDHIFSFIASEGPGMVLSFTLTDGFLDEYTTFDLPDVEEELSDEQFFAEHSDDENPDTADHTSHESDNHRTNAIGIHVLGFPIGNETLAWKTMIWYRIEDKISFNWITLSHAILNQLSIVTFRVTKVLSTLDEIWNVKVMFNASEVAEFSNLLLPRNYTINMRQWTYEQHVPKSEDPFNPFSSISVIKEVLVPLPKSEPCHYGRSIFDTESGIVQINVGVSNNTDFEPNIVPYQTAYTICHPCLSQCDRYKCDETCHVDLDQGYDILHITLTDLDLTEGSYIKSNNTSADDVGFVSQIYYILIQAINGAGLQSLSVSPGVMIDTTPPVIHAMHATDADYSLIYPASYQSSTSQLSTWWDITDLESPVTHLMIAVGSKPNISDVYPYHDIKLTASIIINYLNEPLQDGHKYYVSLRATNAAGLSVIGWTRGITIAIDPPDVININVQPSYDLEYTKIPGQEMLICYQQTGFSVTVTGNSSSDVYAIEWGSGVGTNDEYITPVQMFDSRIYNVSTLSLQEDGYFYAGNERTTSLTYLAEMTGQVNISDGSDPGTLRLEPGLCVFHQVYAQNQAHLRTKIPVSPVCICRKDDYIFDSRGSISIILSPRINFSGKGIGGSFISGLLNEVDIEYGYINSANVSFKHFIVNPNSTLQSSSRFLSGRIKSYMGHSFFIAPTYYGSTIYGPIEITMSFDGLNFDISYTSPRILYWNKDEGIWKDVEESCGIQSITDVYNMTVQAWFCGSTFVDAPANLTKLSSVMIGLFSVDNDYNNLPPKLLPLSKVAKAHSGELVEKTLHYTDPEDDQVVFTLHLPPDYGMANLSENGILLYKSEAFYEGIDVLTVTMMEIELPDGVFPHSVQENISIAVSRRPTPPLLIFHLYEELAGKTCVTHLDQPEIRYEGNSTGKMLGTLFSCDMNSRATIQLHMQHQDSNITVYTEEIPVQSHHKACQATPNEYIEQCMATNMRVYDISVTHDTFYHGRDKIIFIGYANQSLYSEPITLDLAVMISPCGAYGSCYSHQDPECIDSIRAESFASYECECDNWFRESEWCDANPTGKIVGVISMLVGGIALILLAVFLLPGFIDRRYKSFVARNKVSPSTELSMDELKHKEASNEDSEKTGHDCEVDSTSADSTSASSVSEDMVSVNSTSEDSVSVKFKPKSPPTHGIKNTDMGVKDNALYRQRGLEARRKLFTDWQSFTNGITSANGTPADKSQVAIETGRNAPSRRKIKKIKRSNKVHNGN